MPPADELSGTNTREVAVRYSRPTTRGHFSREIVIFSKQPAFVATASDGRFLEISDQSCAAQVRTKRLKPSY
jgi:hypothetical protein